LPAKSQGQTNGDHNGSSDDSYDSSDDSPGSSDNSSDDSSDSADKSDDDDQDLPLLWGRKLSEAWRRHFIPSLIAWAGAQENPLVISGDLDDVVADIWSQIFPRVVLDCDDIAILVKVVSLIQYYYYYNVQVVLSAKRSSRPGNTRLGKLGICRPLTCSGPDNRHVIMGIS